jgi:hypothetical protein
VSLAVYADDHSLFNTVATVLAEGLAAAALS